MINMSKTWKDIPGFFNFDDLYTAVVEEAKDNSHFVEIGSLLGRSTAYLATEIKLSGKKIQFDAVDLWDNVGVPDFPDEFWEKHGKNGLYELFLNNMKECFADDTVNPIRMSSVEASKLYQDESLDFIFLDANHTYECVMEDLVHWWPKLKIGEVFAGHDVDWTGVKTAVEEFFVGKPIRIERTSWIVIK